MGKEAPKKPTPVHELTQKEKERAYACGAVWAFEHGLELIEDFKNQKMSWVHVSNRMRASRDMFRNSSPDVRPIRPKPIAEYIPAVNLFYTDNGNKNRLDKCAAILKDPALRAHHDNIRRAQQVILSKEPLDRDIDSLIHRLYGRCAD